MVNKLKKEFGFLNEADEDNSHIEDQVIGQLDRSAKLDEVDTVTFGLETDDGKIVKVYVNAEQADEFEKALSEKLGEIDDIEEVLNELSKDFEIIDVEWPDQPKEGEEEEEEVEDGQPETDGSEIMNQKVWNKKSEGRAKISKDESFAEDLNFGERATLTIMEATEGNTIEGRLTTATQLLIYHAILELGIPEIALNKSPYKSSIVQSIKERATDMQKDPEVKTALKMFVQRAIDGTGGGASQGPDAKPDGVIKMDEPKAKEDEKNKEDMTTDGEKKEEPKKTKKEVKEALQLVEGLTQEFWGAMDAVLNYIGKAEDVAKLKDSTKFKALVSRSSMAIPKVVKSELRIRLNKLVADISSQASLHESVTANDISKLLTDLFDLVDPTTNKDLSKTLIGSHEWKTFMLSARPALATKFKGASAQKFRDLMASTEEAMTLAKPTSVVPSKVETIPGTGMTEEEEQREQRRKARLAERKQLIAKMNELLAKVEIPAEEPKIELKEAAEWTYTMDDQDNAVITFENLKFSLNPEELEKAVKAVNGKSAIVLADAEEPKKKVTFSPRGVNLVIKQVGNSKTYQMTAEQIKDFMKFAVEGAEGKKPEEIKEGEHNRSFVLSVKQQESTSFEQIIQEFGGKAKQVTHGEMGEMKKVPGAVWYSIYIDANKVQDIAKKLPVDIAKQLVQQSKFSTVDD